MINKIVILWDHLLSVVLVDGDDVPPWEKELQQELQDYEMINEGGELDDADIENEILQEIEQESKTI